MEFTFLAVNRYRLPPKKGCIVFKIFLLKLESAFNGLEAAAKTRLRSFLQSDDDLGREEGKDSGAHGTWRHKDLGWT